MPLKLFAEKQRLTTPYMHLLIVAGVSSCLFSAYRFDTSRLDLQFIILAAFTVLVGSRIGIQIPKIKAEITVSDTFVFLTMLLYGGESAVLLAGAEAFCSSFRFSRKWVTRFFNASLLAFSIFITVWTLRFCYGRITDLAVGSYHKEFLLAIFCMAFLHYGVNSGLAALRDSLKLNEPFWQTWRDHYLWTSITYFAGASAAAIIAKVMGTMGPYAFGIAVPIILIIYFTYQTYRKNIDSAQHHVEELNQHIAEQQRISQALQQSEAHFRGSFDYAAIGMALVGLDGRWLRVNDSLCKIVGYSSDELLAMTYHEITHPADLAQNEASAHKLLEGISPSFHMEKRYIHRDGSEVWTLLSASLVRSSTGEPLHFITQVQDITDRKRAEERLQYDAFHDALTGLPNRALFMDHLRHAVERACRRKDYNFAVLFLDFDRFKVINDSLGHLLGDQLLVEIASRILGCVRSIDTVARLGGDEFTILLEDITHPLDTDEVLERIQKAMAQPFSIGGHEVYTSASIGVALNTTSYKRAEDVLRDADTAMYRAKQLGRARHVIFDPDMHSTAVELLSLETDLRKAVERGELLLHYQPIFSLTKPGLVGFEALVRWQHPRRGMVPPAEFIPLAEETGLILQIGEWVLRESCRQLKVWQDKWAVAHALYVSVNLSGRQFTQPDLVERVVFAAHGAGLPLRCLKLEVTESVLMENIDTAAARLEQLRGLGVEISIDDFGTGYSSLSYLHKLPIDTLKVDRSFVMRMNGEDENTEIVRTIITLAKSLEMKVIAEGVETTEQKALLQALRCDAVQGYLFSKPLEAEAAEKLLPKETGAPATGKQAGLLAFDAEVREISDTYQM